MDMKKHAVMLVGHGGPAKDTPAAAVAKLKRLEAERNKRGELEMSPEEAEVDALVRNWPRTPKTDPYKYGLEAIAHQLAALMPEAEVVTCYNEFCAPSLEDGAGALVAKGHKDIELVTTMFTRGGVHSECEIPAIVARLEKEHPGVRLRYAWPFPEKAAAAFLAAQLKRPREAVAA